MGVLAALSEAFEDREEELSARARGAAGGGLALDVLGGLNGRPCGNCVYKSIKCHFLKTVIRPQ